MNPRAAHHHVMNEEVLLLGLLALEAMGYVYAVVAWALPPRASNRPMYVLHAGGAVVVGGIAAGLFATGYLVSAISETVVATCLGGGGLTRRLPEDRGTPPGLRSSTRASALAARRPGSAPKEMAPAVTEGEQPVDSLVPGRR